MVRNYIRIPIEEQKRRGPKEGTRLPNQDIQEQILNRLTLKVPKKSIAEQFQVSLYIINRILEKNRNPENAENAQ